VTIRTGSFYIAIGKKTLAMFTIELLICSDIYVSLFQKIEKELLSHFMMDRTVSSGKVIENDLQAIETPFNALVKSINNIFWGNALFLCLDRYRGTMFIRSADKHDVPVVQAEVSDKDISWQISSGNMSDMKWTVGIG
jgi:hypothetical protein